jgi:hypothetical protein
MPNPLLEAGLADGNELVGRALKPGGHHQPVIMPYLAKLLPQAGVAVDHPILDEVAQSEFVSDGLIHPRGLLFQIDWAGPAMHQRFCWSKGADLLMNTCYLASKSTSHRAQPGSVQ